MLRASRPPTAALLSPLVALLLAAPAAPAAAQGPALTLILPVGHDWVGVRGAGATAPTVRVVDAAGRERAATTATERSEDTWFAGLNRGRDTLRPMLLEAGDTVEAAAGSRSATAVVPPLVARADAAADQVSGEAPGFDALAIQVHSDPDWFGPTQETDPTFVSVDASGQFTASLGPFDLRAGTWGEVIGETPGGHVALASFAPPSLTVLWHEPLALARADPSAVVEAVVRAADDTVMYRSGPAIPLGGPLFLVPLFDPDDLESEPYRLQVGEGIALEVDGRLALQGPLPLVTVGIDALQQRLMGLAPAGWRIKASLVPRAGAEPVRDTTVAAADGSWQTAIGAVALGSDALAEIVAYGGGGIAQVTQGRTLGSRFDLYGHRATGILSGRGAVEVKHRTAAGAAAGRALVEANHAGAFEAELFEAPGRPATLRPGDTVVTTPAFGPEEVWSVPPVTAAVDASRRFLSGSGPPGAIVVARVYTRPVGIFFPEPYEGPYLELATRGDEAGNFTLACVQADCVMEYGTLEVGDGRTTGRLFWLAAPLTGIDVTRAFLSGPATAGSQVTVDLPSLADPLTKRTFSRPSLGRGLPQWTVDASDVYTNGIPAGERLSFAVGDLRYAVRVPRLTWQADTAGDAVAGTGPRGRFMVVVAFPPPGDNTRDPRDAVTEIGPDGRWAVHFEDYDLQAGDALEFYLPYEGFYMQWSVAGIEGNDPPTPTPWPTRVAASARAFLPAISVH